MRELLVRRDGTHLCQTREIYQGQVENVRAVYPQRNRELANAFVLACHPERLLLNFLPNFVEICEPLVDMQELAPFGVRRGVWRRFRGCRGMNELEHQWPARYDSLTSRKKIPANNTFPGNRQRHEHRLNEQCHERTFPGHSTSQLIDSRPIPSLRPLAAH